eukprot:CAMPEP_0178992492 /NCGR_PEP_ID=MMETSP0795-20121207/6145_1 /TAXON_ID=88552 /ORGANISM="Amoebophrya sp., Strain Ameob2" /LENGTH=37 /DNA_ID= /DNA_START= /DNA_END= /DNA_ORIENTATION=
MAHLPVPRHPSPPMPDASRPASGARVSGHRERVTSGF